MIVKKKKIAKVCSYCKTDLHGSRPCPQIRLDKVIKKMREIFK